MKEVNCYKLYCYPKDQSCIYDSEVIICVPKDQNVNIGLLLRDLGDEENRFSRETEFEHHERGNLRLYSYWGNGHFSDKKPVCIYPFYQGTKESGDQLFFICLSEHGETFIKDGEDIDLSKLKINSDCIYEDGRLYFDQPKK